MTDSASDLSKELYKEYDIDMVPLNVLIDDKSYEDVIEIEPKTIYDELKNGKSAKTSQPVPEAFKAIFTEYAEKNEPLVYIGFSTELSGTYQSAKIMEDIVKTDHPDAPIHVIDARGASLGFGLIVLHAAKLAKGGASVEEVIEAVKHYSEHMEYIFTVDDLEYLKRGGRISKTSAFVGGLLNIKPILNVEDGKLVPIEKIRGSKKVLSRMLELMDERGTDFKNQTIGINHGDDIKKAEALSQMIQDKYGVDKKDIIIEMIGAVIGAHVGPGTLAVYFLNKTK